jgi:hypothetical protein
MSDITVTSNEVLYQRLDEMRNEVTDLAMTNIGNLTDGGHFTRPEVLAMTEFEKLRLLGDYDLLGVMLKGESITKIEKMELHNVLPASYTSPYEAIEIEVGLSRSEQSNIKDINNHIIPYVKERENVSIAEFWQTKKSNLREIVPYLKAMITSEKSAIDSVNEGVDRFVEEVKDVDPTVDDEEATEVAIDNLIDTAKNETNKGLRSILRPNDIPPIPAIVFRNGVEIYIVGKATEEQIRGLPDDDFDFHWVEIEDVPYTRIVRELQGKKYKTAEEIIYGRNQLGEGADRDGDQRSENSI